MARFRPMLAEYDVTEQQWRVIRVLAEAEALDATTLAERCTILTPSLTRIIRTLEERKLISRVKDEEDGRRIVLTITDAGRALIGAVAPGSNAIYATLDREFGPERVQRLLDLLDDLARTKPK